MERVVVLRPMVGLCHMQVCAVDNATDAEILDECNRENPAGTTLGWVDVVREPRDGVDGPIACADDAGRVHLLVGC